MRRGAALAAAIGVLVAGCTAEGGAPGGSATAGALGPLDQLMTSAWGGVDASLPDAAARTIADITKRENLIAACMNEQGFEYLPNVPAAADLVITTEGIDRASREFAVQYGFGIVRQPETEVGQISWQGVDPNWTRTEAMSEAEREAWTTALYGDVTDRQVDAFGESTSREGGCMDQTSDGGFAVADEAGEFLGRFSEDGAFDELDNEWSACMHESGFEHESPTAASNAFSDEFVAMLDDHSLENDDVAGLAEREIAVAVASWDCKAETDYEARFRVIRDQVQQAWIDEHRAELDEWLAAMAEQ